MTLCSQLGTRLHERAAALIMVAVESSGADEAMRQYRNWLRETLAVTLLLLDA